MRTYSALVVAALLCLATPTLGQQGLGDTELQLQGSLSVGNSGGQKDSGTVDLQFGRFFSDHQEIGITVMGQFQSGGKFGGTGGPYYRYNVAPGNVVPYLGISPGSTFGTTSNSGERTFTATGEAGVRFFADLKTSFTVSANKTYMFKSKEFDKGLVIQFGFSHLWGK